MKVILIAPPIMDYRARRLQPIAQDKTRNCTPYGLFVLTNILRLKGHDVTLLDLIAHGTHSIRRFHALFQDADLVGIGATSLSWPTALDVIRQLRRLNPTLPIALGGIHPTIFDKYLLERFPVDYVIRGEGEIALPALCESLDQESGIEHVPNLSWKTKEGKFIRNKLGPKIKPEEIGKFPLPAYGDLQPGVYKGLAIESSRGCAFDCSFCSTSYRQSWRGMPPGVFVERLERLLPYLQRTVCRSVHIIDDEFSTNPSRAISIIQLIREKGLKLGLVYDSRANDLLYDGFVETMADYTHQFLVGAECGYDDGLKKIGKGTTCKKLEAASRELYNHGIADRANFSFILGLPWEGKREIEKTIEFATHLFSEYGIRVLLQWYCLIPGSRLWEEERNKMVLTEAMYDDYGFFQNLHFYHASTKLSPSEVWKIEDMVQQLQWLAHLAHPNAHMIENSVPAPLTKYYPRNILQPNHQHSDGLASLREVANPHLFTEVGVPNHPINPKEETICR